jgi:hypothetical protein
MSMSQVKSRGFRDFVAMVYQLDCCKAWKGGEGVNIASDSFRTTQSNTQNPYLKNKSLMLIFIPTWLFVSE